MQFLLRLSLFLQIFFLKPISYAANIRETLKKHCNASCFINIASLWKNALYYHEQQLIYVIRLPCFSV